MSASSIGLFVSILMVVLAAFYSVGYRNGVKETERRWSEAVERKRADDERT